ncbi:MAG: hypothetical protein CVU04_02430 [Bacteroidetes bacterium HGW-Bacteroidetes-20]|nr:MAG: hypothetical protein CVU04_02430 [Bacteroidetes bacterium HGW-Bacteroidetes-20]
MNPLNQIKNKYLKKVLNTHKVLRDKQIISLDEAKSIGIITRISDEDSYKLIYSIFSNLQNQEKNGWLMGYIDDKIVPHFCLQQLTADYFCKKSLNWFGKPDFVQMNDFLKKDFDILIDFSDASLPAIQYVLAQSHAKFIIGTIPESKEYYDLFIQIEDPNNKYEILNNIQLYTKKLYGK